jgi:hypothetical protein
MRHGLLLLLLCCVILLSAAGSATAADPCAGYDVCFTASPSPVQFGSVAVGETKTVDVTLTGHSVCCGTWLNDNSVLTNFPTGSGFALDWGKPGLCPSFAMVEAGAPTIAGDGSCTVRASITGTAEGQYQGTVTLAWGCCHSMLPTVIELDGTVVANPPPTSDSSPPPVAAPVVEAPPVEAPPQSAPPTAAAPPQTPVVVHRHAKKHKKHHHRTKHHRHHRVRSA